MSETENFDNVTGAEILAIPMVPEENDAGAASVREYLAELLRVLWIEREGFSGKRPFGNSSWHLELFEALVRGGYPVAIFDEDGYLEKVTGPFGNQLIARAIRALND